MWWMSKGQKSQKGSSTKKRKRNEILAEAIRRDFSKSRNMHRDLEKNGLVGALAYYNYLCSQSLCISIDLNLGPSFCIEMNEVIQAPEKAAYLSSLWKISANSPFQLEFPEAVLQRIQGRN